MKLVIQLVLWIVIIFLGYKLYSSVIGPVEFNKVKEARYTEVIAKLKDIRDSQLAHQEVTGNFSGNFDSLVRFLDTAQFAITQRRDTSYADVEKNEAFGVDGYYIEDIIVDTLGFVSIKDSLFGDSDRYRTMMNVPGVEGKTFDLQAGKYEKNGTKYSVFLAEVDKAVVLEGQNKDLIAQERQVNSVDGVNGPTIKVGAMDEINTSGNWPKIYDSAKDN